MKPIIQSQISDCSLAALAMVAAAHGMHTEWQEFRRRFATSLRGANLKQLMNHASTLGFATRAVRVDLGDLGKLQLPCILHWDLNHFVVLKKVHGKRAITVLDPAVGERRLHKTEVSLHFTGVALELTPTAHFIPEKSVARLRFSQFTGRMQGVVGPLAQIFSVALVLELFAIAGPLLSQWVVDDVIVARDTELLDVLIVGFGLLLVVQTALALARSWMVMVLSQTLSLQWVGNVFGHLTKLPLDFFEKRHLGDVVSRFGAVHEIQRTFTTSAVEAILDGIMASAALIMMLLYAPALTGIAIAALASYGLLRWVAWGPLRNAASERLVVSAKENTHFLETLRAMQPLKLFGREQERRARWQNLVVEVQNRDVRTARMEIAYSVGNSFIFGIENLMVLWLGARLVMNGPSGGGESFGVGMLFAFTSYKLQFTGRFSKLIDFAFDLRMLGLHFERLSDIALTPPEMDTPQGNLPENDLSLIRPSLELRNVSFRFSEGEPWLLRHANLVVAAGDSVAVTGPSGAGKTTLLKILLGLLPPNEGEVLYGGIPIRQLGLSNVRKRIGTVMQDDVLLSGSIAENICFFDSQPDFQRIEECARLAMLHDDIVRMPMGYHTLTGDLGSGLSGGQKQRLLLARALYKNPEVLALDEATSHLDLDNERAVANVLRQMRVTQLIVAHRPETIAGTQRVVLLDAGTILEAGAPNQAGTPVAGATCG